MDILLSGFYPNYRYGLAIFTLRSYLLKDPALAASGRVDAEGFPLSLADERVVDRILARRPDFLGFSCYVWSVDKVLRVSARLRRRGFAGPIVLGGPEATHTAARLLEENPAVTAVVRGEGEETLRELALHYAGPSQELAGIAGVTFRRGGAVISNPERALIADLNALPSPYVDGSADLQADDITYGLGAYESYRGCVFECSFCLWGKTTNTRFRPIEEVERELRAIMSSRIRRVWMADAVANLDKERFKRILRLLAFENPNKVLFDFEVVAQMLDEETIELLAALPGGYIACGLQSTDPAVLKAAHRFANLERFRKNIELLRRRNGKLEIYIDLIYGLPGETWASYREAVGFALSFFPDRLQMHQLRALPGTQFHKDAARLGLAHDDRPPYFVRRTPTFSPADFLKARRLGRVVELYNILPPVKLAAVAAARRSAGGLLPVLEDFAAPLGGVDRRRIDLEAISGALDAFLRGRRKILTSKIAGALREFGRYYIRGLATNTVSPLRLGQPRGAYRMSVQRLEHDFSEILSGRSLMSPELDWGDLPRKRTTMVFNKAGLDEKLAKFILLRESFLPVLPH